MNVYYLREMADWLDDLYDSPSTDEESILERKQEVIQSIIEEFENGSSKVRIRWVIHSKMNIKGYVYSSDLLEVFYTMVETGDYEGTLFKKDGLSDILIIRKPWHKRNRILFGFINSTIGYISTIAAAFIIGLIFGKSCNR